MTRTTNARIAGITFLFYIAAGIASMVLYARASGGDGVSAQLADISQHVFQLHLTILLGLIEAVCALVLAVTLYGITRVQDNEIALLAMLFRAGEGILVAISTRETLDRLWLASATMGSDAPNPPVLAQTVGVYLLQRPGWEMAATLFAIGSTLFCFLLLRGRMIPVPMAWLGLIASLLLVVGLPLQLARFFTGPLISLLWLPMLAFEAPLGVWLLMRGVKSATAR